MYYYIYIFTLCLILFVLWFLYGGKEHKFIGLDPLCPEYDLKDAEEIPDIKIDLDNAKEDFDREEKMKSVQTRFDQKQGYRQRSKGESVCKQCLEFWFKKPFFSIRPKWLKSPYSENNLELDCYNADFKLAAEYNGIQHYVFPNKYMQTQEEFELQLAKDKFKFDRCNKLGIHLIIVPYTTKLKDIPEFLRRRLPPHLRDLAIEEPEINL